MNSTCNYMGIEDARGFDDRGDLVLGATMVQMQQTSAYRACVATQVVVSPSQRKITAVPSPSGIGTISEKNWVHLEGSTAVHTLFDAQLRTHLLKCRSSGCAASAFVQWRLVSCSPCLRKGSMAGPSSCPAEDLVRLPKIRSGTNWVVVSPGTMVAVAHEARQIVNQLHAGVEYASRLLRWERHSGRLSVYQTSMFSQWTHANVPAKVQGVRRFQARTPDSQISF